MDPVEVTFYALHSIFAGLWAGSVVFMALAVIPVARDGDIGVEAFQSVATTLVRLSRASALILLLTGSHMAAVRYTSESLTGTTGGYLVIAMVVLWLVLIATVEIGTSKLRSGTGRDKIREPAREARPFYLVASVTAVLLLVIAGLLSAYNLGFL